IPRSSNASTPLELSNNTAPAPELVSSTLPDFGPSNSASGAPTTSVPGSVLSKPSTLVACPICGNGIPFTYTNTHLDNYCLLKQNDPNYTIPYKVIITQKSDIIALYEKCGASGKSISNATANTSTSVSISSTTPGGSPRRTNDSQISPGLSFNSNGGKKPVATYPEPKRIPKLTYSILNDKQLRKKLQELGLPTHGDKQLMQKRHAEYVTIYNANCDATRPQTQAQLMKAMEVWERSYEKDMQTREAQRRALEQQQQIQQKELAQQKKKEEERAATENDTEPGTPTLSSSQSSSQNGGSNHVNNDAVAVAVATASAFAHALKYADEYAELIADVKKRMQADKEKKTLEDNQQAQMRTQPNS
ncbi:E3 ubiquitin-protein ligase rad18, partial [Lobosporangium transversale]